MWPDRTMVHQRSGCDGAFGARRIAAAFVLLIAAVTGSMAFSPAALATTVPCSASALISAISTANGTRGGGTVTLTNGCVYTLTAINNTTDGGGVGLPVISGNVTIQGNGGTITRSTAGGTPVFRLLDVASAGSLALSSVTLSNGLANNGTQGGGGIFNHGGLTISGSTFSGNSAPSSSGTSGGAINNSGTLNVTTSTFTGNSAQEGGGVFNQKTATISNDTFTSNQATIYGGGALLNAAGTMTVTGDTFTSNSGPGGGAIDNDTTLTISDSTFQGNTAGSNGGGAVENFGPTTMTQSTLSGNSSQYGANILNYTGHTLSLSMSIVANGQGGPNCGGGAAVTDGGYNIDTGTTCGFSSGNHSMSSIQPQLGALASNGGPSQTMALPAGSPAVDAIAASTPGCTGSTDQRGITRPQGPGCDIGAYELVQSGSGQPTTPTGLTVTGVTASSVSLSWNASAGGVTGYTVYRNGKSVGTTGGPNATTYTDVTVSPSTTYQYTVDAFSGSTHSAQSQPVQATTPAPNGVQPVQSGAVSTATQVTSTTITLATPVHAGDLLVGWFGQYNSSGQVKVSDGVNGAWTRAANSTTYSNGGGDIALYYLQNTAAAPSGLTITITAPSPTYLQGAAGEYSGVATSGALDQVAIARGNSTSVDSGATAAVGASELVVGGILTGGSPGTVTPGSSQGQPFTLRTQTGSGSADLEDVLSSSAGAQDARATLGSATDWYAVAAVFHQYGSGNTQPPSTPTGLAATTVTSSSVALTWNASTGGAGGVAGYTVYRNGAAIGTTGASTTTYTDSTVQPSTAYSYTVDAFDESGNHSAQSTALPVTTPAGSQPGAHWVQGGAVSTGSRVTSVTIQLTSPVGAGDLLVGWFGQYDSSGQVQVSDNVNGAWTRSASTTFSNGGGDIALYYLQNSAAAPSGLTITITAANATYLQGALADYGGMATTGALDQTAVAKGNSTSVDSGPTASVGAGELVVGGIITGGSPGTVTPGSSQGQAFTIRSQAGSGSADLEDVLASTAGAQNARATFSAATDWYAMAAVFHVASGS